VVKRRSWKEVWKFLVGVKLKEDGLGTMSRMKLWAATAGSGGEATDSVLLLYGEA
jgi:hypothetical protein